MFGIQCEVRSFASSKGRYTEYPKPKEYEGSKKGLLRRFILKNPSPSSGIKHSKLGLGDPRFSGTA